MLTDSMLREVAARHRCGCDWPLAAIVWLSAGFALLAGSVATAAAQELPPILQTLDSQWTIDLATPVDPQRERLGVPVPLSLYVVAREDFADVRILSVDPQTRTAIEIPYQRLQPVNVTTDHEAPASRSAATPIANGTQFVLDLGQEPQAINEIVIDVARDAHDYHRNVEVFGHDGDAEQATVLTKSGLLHDSTSPAGTIRICRIDFPASRFRYYRVAISGESGLPVSAIRAVERVEVRPARLEVAPVHLEWAMDAGGRSSIVSADLNYRRLPTNGVLLDVTYGGGDYCRQARVEVTDQADSTANWKLASTGAIYRFTQSNGTEIEQSSIEYPSAIGGHVRVIIENGDQPPLMVNNLTAISIPQLLVCEQKPFQDPARQVSLYAGDFIRTLPVSLLQDAPPDFDDRELSEGVGVGPRAANPFKLATYDPRVLYDSRYQSLRWWSWVGVVLTAGLIAAFVFWRRTSS